MVGDTVTLLAMCLWFFLFTVGSGLLAARKRRSVGGWVVLGLLFGLFAFVVLLLLPTLPDVDPARPHRCLLGIECDGPVCRAAATAPDRDRLRSTVLKGLDRTMHRIWARERLRDSDAALLRLYDRLRLADIGLVVGYGGGAELLRLYDRLQHRVAPPVTPSPAATGPVCAHCGGPLSATARFCDPCGAPAVVPTGP